MAWLGSLHYDYWQTLCWVLLAFSALCGLMALVKPKLFARLATGGSRWIDTQRLLAVLDRRFDVDRYVLPHSRLLGGLVVAAVAVLAWVLWTR